MKSFNVVCRHTALVAALLLTLLGGCTTVTSPVEGSVDIPGKIREEQLVEVGDDVIIRTADDAVYEFKVTGVDNETIKGKEESVAIDDIVGLQTREFSAGKTAGLVGGVAGSLYWLYFTPIIWILLL